MGRPFLCLVWPEELIREPTTPPHSGSKLPRSSPLLKQEGSVLRSFLRVHNSVWVTIARGYMYYPSIKIL
jgi:hypothetical protein